MSILKEVAGNLGGEGDDQMLCLSQVGMLAFMANCIPSGNG